MLPTINNKSFLDCNEVYLKKFGSKHGKEILI